MGAFHVRHLVYKMHELPPGKFSLSIPVDLELLGSLKFETSSRNHGCTKDVPGQSALWLRGLIIADRDHSSWWACSPLWDLSFTVMILVLLLKCED